MILQELYRELCTFGRKPVEIKVEMKDLNNVILEATIGDKHFRNYYSPEQYLAKDFDEFFHSVDVAFNEGTE